MTDKSQKPSPLAPLGGVVVGIAVFLGVNITSGRAVIPTPETITNKQHGMSKVVYPESPTKSGAPAVAGAYSVCATCHQAEGQGMPGAFPPLAGSEWITGNPEVPVKIVLVGMSGPITVKGATFNSAMPPPPGMTDEQIAEAVTYARSNFGNKASAVDAAFVKKVRESLAGRTNPFTAPELHPLLGEGGGEAAPAGAEGVAGAAAPPAAGAPAAPAPAAGAPAAPAPAAPAPAEPTPVAPPATP